MIKFFRKIRQNLLLENKTGKYFKYAIGEIILVVIGILIALQINNWNENRKEQNLLQTYYKQILEDLDEQKNYSIQIITQLESSIASYKTYTQLFETRDLKVNEVIEALNKVDLRSPYIFFRFNTMETLQSTGEIRIFPEDIRNKLITHKWNLDSWTTVTNKILDMYFTNTLRLGEKGIGGFIPRLKNQTEIEKEINKHISPIEAVLLAESAFNTKTFAEVQTRDRLIELLEDIKEIEKKINLELKENK